MGRKGRTRKEICQKEENAKEEGARKEITEAPARRNA
jgi:hypothetical protein